MKTKKAERPRTFVGDGDELVIKLAPVAEIDREIDQLGTLTFEHSDNVVRDCQCDRLAHINGTMMVASFVTSPNEVKAIRAILHNKKGKVGIRTEGLTFQYPSRSKDEYSSRFGDCYLAKDDAGYNLFVYKLDYGKIHATVISKSRNLLMYSSPESVWARLADSEFYETPLLAAWMPYITKKLVEIRYLKECRCYRANCAVLGISRKEQLDEIIVEGLKSGAIRIP
jgi:hypothetical protein